MSYPPQGEPAPPVNLKTKARHRREVWWQIYLPLILGALLFGLLVLGISLSGVGDTSIWADVSAIWVIVPIVIMALIPLVAFVAAIVGVTLLIIKAPPKTYQLQNMFAYLEAEVRRITDRIVEPFLKFHSGVARMKAVRLPSRNKDIQEPSSSERIISGDE
jgi:hypothetical protein